MKKNPCMPSPCGLYSECRAVGDTPSCSCLPNYIGSPPNCRPECVVNTDCPSDKSCIAEKCRNPCEGACGINSECRIQNHIANCICRPGFTGDPFTQCIEYIGKNIRRYKSLYHMLYLTLFLRTTKAYTIN